MSCCDKTLEVEDLLNQPLHGNNLTLAVGIDPNFKYLLKDAERDQAVKLMLSLTETRRRNRKRKKMIWRTKDMLKCNFS